MYNGSGTGHSDALRDERRLLIFWADVTGSDGD